MKDLKCFIASAFGKKDVDSIYTEVVKPVLKNGKIKPMRVDRVEHNDDIDDKILELIDRCDFCIADLTYARPSVYYEAGRVHGMGKPVIFLANSSHFKPKEADEFGNFRIHFDLQMKNIIKWTKPNKTLERKLTSRVNVVTAPILRALRAEAQERQAEAQFSKLTQKEKFLAILKLAGTGLSRLRFSVEKEDRPWAKVDVLGVKKMRGTPVFVWCLAQASFTKSRLQDIMRVPHGSKSVSDFLKSRKVDRREDMVSHILCCGLRATPESRIADALYYFRRHDRHKVYSYVRDSRPYSDNIAHIHFLDGIDSLERFQEQLREHLPLLGKLDD